MSTHQLSYSMMLHQRNKSPRLGRQMIKLKSYKDSGPKRLSMKHRWYNKDSSKIDTKKAIRKNKVKQSESQWQSYYNNICQSMANLLSCIRSTSCTSHTNSLSSIDSVQEWLMPKYISGSPRFRQRRPAIHLLSLKPALTMVTSRTQ